MGLLDQLNTTWDTIDYLWYTTNVVLDSNEGFLRGEKWPVLKVLSAGSALHEFINGQYSETANGKWGSPKLIWSEGVNLRAGVNKISVLAIFVVSRKCGHIMNRVVLVCMIRFR